MKNEIARIDRCVNSLLPHVDAAIITDTGSTDGTCDRIRELFGAVNKPVEIHHTEFHNFSQARNEALAAARNSQLPWNYLLLADADMELVAKPGWFNGENGLSYDMQQVAGDVVYWNRRLLSRKATGCYVGVTHEYLDVPTNGDLVGAHFIDHADGANRDGKFVRDIKLLEEALKTETNQGLIGRYYFYLAQTYFDMQDWTKAAEYYKKRVEHGGWDEEIWNAQVHYAHCLGNQGDHPGFVWNMLQAYEMRPQRAESLYDLAKFFRELSSANRRSLLFSAPGMEIERPDDKLFVSNYTYTTGLKEEFAICAYYDPQQRERGADVCNELALARTGTNISRQLARWNQYWYLKPLSAHVRSFQPIKIDFTPPDSYLPMNPSIVNHNGQLLTLIRTVNYEITEEGRYISRIPGDSIAGVDIIRTRNFLARIRDNGQLEHQVELQLPGDLPAPKFELVRGFEDSRLFSCGQLWTISTARELNAQGMCEQVIAPIFDYSNWVGYGDWKVVHFKGEKQNQKNWMPWVRNGEMQFVYRLGTIVDSTGMVVQERVQGQGQTLGHLSGGTQVVEVSSLDNGFYLALVHEAGFIPGRTTRYYSHRFVVMEADGVVINVSKPFFFHDRQIEFAAGMVKWGDELLISYGVRDQEAWIARMRIDQVLEFCL